MTSDKVVLLHVQTHLANLGDHHSDFCRILFPGEVSNILKMFNCFRKMRRNVDKRNIPGTSSCLGPCTNIAH